MENLRNTITGSGEGALITWSPFLPGSGINNSDIAESGRQTNVNFGAYSSARNPRFLAFMARVQF